jgi:fumarylacetoacetase
MSPTSEFDHHFSLANIPFGIASVPDRKIPPQAATRIQSFVVLLAPLAEAGHFKDIEYPLIRIFEERTLNTFAALPKSVHLSVRTTLQKLLHGGDEEIALRLPVHGVVPAHLVQMHLPVRIGDFTDFSVSAAHVVRAGEAVLGKSFLPPAFKHFPIGYGGRSSSVVVSGTPIERPLGQFVDRKSGDEKKVVLAPSREVDYELEVAAVVGKPVAMGERLYAKDADGHIFGVSLDI